MATSAANGVTSLKSTLQTPGNPQLDVELGVPNVLPGGAWQDWTAGTGSGKGQKANQFTVGRDPNAPAISSLVNMIRRDGQARALLNLLTIPIRGTLPAGGWHMPEGEDPEGDEAKFANDLWDLPPQNGGMSVPKSKFLRQTLLSLAHGFSAFEHVRYIPTDGPLKGKVTLRKMGYRDPRTIWFLTDDHGGFAGMRQKTSFAGRSIDVTIPMAKSWFYTGDDSSNPFYGISMFEPAHEHYQIKRKLYYISHLAAQFAAVPGRLGMLPQTPGTTRQTEQFRSALMNFAFGGAMLVPYGYDVKPFNAGAQFDFLKLIDHHNTMMAGSVLAKFLQNDDRQTLIDNSKGDASADMFVQMVASLATEIAESWTQHLMPQYIAYNFGTGVCPEFKFAPMTDDQKAALETVFNSVVVSGTLNCTPEFVRELEKKLADAFDLDIDYTAIEAKEKEAAIAQAKAQADQAKMDAQNAAAAAQAGAQSPTGPGGAPGKGPAGLPPGAGGVPPFPPKVPKPPGQPGRPQMGAVAASQLDDSLDALLVQLSQIAGMDVTEAPLDDISDSLER